ncbi:hypothetical protein GCM10010429_36590 [Micromonospora olivasterospora]
MTYNYPQAGHGPKWHWATESYADRLDPGLPLPGARERGAASDRRTPTRLASPCGPVPPPRLAQPCRSSPVAPCACRCTC